MPGSPSIASATGPLGTRSMNRATASSSSSRPIIAATTRAPTSSRCLDKTAPVIGAPSRGREEHRSHHATYSRRSGRPPTPQVQSHAETCVAFCPTRSEPAARVRCVELAPERGTRRRRDGSTRSDDARARAALAISVLQRPFLPPQGRSSSRLTGRDSVRRRPATRSRQRRRPTSSSMRLPPRTARERPRRGVSSRRRCRTGFSAAS